MIAAVGGDVRPGPERETLQALRERWSPNSAQVDGREWRYIDTAGPGPAVVLLPGSQGTSEVFFKPLLRFGQQWRMIAVDYPAEPDAAALADGLAGLHSHLGLPPVTLVGSSLGSYVAQVVGARYPDMIERLLLGNAFLDLSDVRSKPAYNPAIIAAQRPDSLKQERLEHLRGMPGGELKAVLLDLVGRQSPEAVKANALAAASAPTAPEPLIDAGRLLLLGCEDDTTITPHMRSGVWRRYASARHVLLPQGEHYPHILAADDYCSILADFISGRHFSSTHARMG